MTFISQRELSQPDRTLHLMMGMVCSRPEMWVGDVTFRSVVLYLIGYDAAVANLTGRDMLFGSDLVRFGHWLSKRMLASHGLPGRRSWFVYVEALYPDDEARLRQLPLLFGQYLQEREQPSATV